MANPRSSDSLIISTPPTTTLPRPFRRAQYQRRSILLLLAALALLYVLASLYVQARLPSDGVLLTEFSAAGLHVATQLGPGDMGLQVGDQIVAVDGRAVEDWAARAWRGEGSAAEWQVGQTISYQVIRAGEPQDVSVALRDFPWGYLPLLRFGVYGLSIVGLVVAVYILLRQPGDVTAQLLFVAAIGMLLVLTLHFQVMTLVTPWLLITESLLKFFARALLFSALLHLFLIFPVLKIKSERIRRRLGCLHIVNPLLSIMAGLWFKRAPLAQWLWMSRVATWLGLLMFSLGLISIMHTYFTEHHPRVQSQIRWMAWGSMVGFFPYLLLTGLPEALTGQPLLTIEVTAFFLVALPISVAVAVTRYRLSDIDTLMWRTLLYTLFGIVLAGVYILLWRILNNFLAAFSLELDGGILVFWVTLMVVSIFWLLAARVSLYADRLLYRSRSHPQELLSQMMTQLTSKIHLNELAILLSETLPQQMGATRGSLMVLTEGGDALELVGDATFTLPLGEWFEMWRSFDNIPILHSVPHPAFPPEVLTLMATQQVELILPLQVGTQLVGILSLGPRVGALAYTTAEVRMLTLLAHQAALAVQNALLVRKIEGSRRRLLDEVALQTQAMAEERNRLNTILQNMADALLVIDASGRIQLVNPAFENLIRWAARSMLGQPIAQVLPLPDLLQAIAQAVKHPGRVEISRVTLTDPRLLLPVNKRIAANRVSDARVLAVSVTALKDHSTIICILRDITHEVEVERLKSEFISAVSHELRTPITSILGFVKLIQRAFNRTIAPALPDKKSVQRAAQRIQGNLDIIIQEGVRLTSLIHDVLDIAALDSGTIEWNDQAYHLEAVIASVVACFQAQVTDKDLTLRSRILGPFPVMFADPARIKQVLLNLISNAVKFTDQGEIVIAARLLALDDRVHNWTVPSTGGVLISVSDTGIGIPHTMLQRIFDRFSQGGDPLVNKPDGTGLGLALSREIIQHYGGILWVESEVDSGSTFYIALPLLLPPETVTDDMANGE